ncbi:2-oxoglutarate carboxylase small subunit [Planctomycetes bacterium Pan216]|uniref:Pyruvate carboxylase n=1 Tax=Kolteria novifilia TaxID=2527975 RepID=A0A518B6N3_9BACT|nr:2-oxoglutarate carboxylase small subunit [Planctomycetes bacterium Pan216]
MKTFGRLLAANRGEIAIRIFRAAHELSIRTVAVYSQEDRFALHRFKAEEAYQVGVPGEPIRSYLDIPKLIDLMIEKRIDAVHPGYGFLSENADFAAACADAGITFVGPSVEILRNLGDKMSARKIATEAGVPVLAGSNEPIRTPEEATALAEKLGYPVMLKAAHGGGGRGMRVVRKAEELAPSLESCQREAAQAFGRDEVFVEKFIQNARHIEVQLLGDQHGNLVHLFERECSIQRRHQKVAEIAPAPNLAPEKRDAICAAAIAIGKQVRYDNAGTVEFLYDEDTGKFYFIEVNPRIQVEHTVTEVVTGVDIVKRQMRIAAGVPLDDPSIGLGDPSRVKTVGFALQCRVTTEDPSNGFVPDHGRIIHYRSAGGMGIRLDVGNAFSGAIVTPFFDSMLVKVTAWGHHFPTAANRMERALQEFRIRGVKTNIPFLLNLVTHQNFIDGKFTTQFLDKTPELFQFSHRRDRATKLLSYLADVTVNGHPLVKSRPAGIHVGPAPVPVVERSTPIPDGTKQILDREGPSGLAKWITEQKKLLLTDTTMRDAHQSLFATRMRTYDMMQIADVYARRHSDLFSLEMWGGATFDTAMRFLCESPWKRLTQLRERIPNILFQMLLRASNAVGYTTYPDNVVREFIKEAASAGIDIFRVFDSLNWIENMTVAMEDVLATGKVCEAAICYTGDILDPKRTKYTLKYYVELAKELEKRGAHILAIKDMSGLCKPVAAGKLVKALKEEIGIPVHFHTHDTAGVQGAAILEASEVGLDIADAAWAPLSGLTSQPNINSVVEMLRFTDRDTGIEPASLNGTSDYWQKVRQYYKPFETNMKASTADVYQYEIPGGQYTNLLQQASSLGLGDRFHEVCETYARVNEMFGDIVKVTPSSKVVGDLAIFMVTNGYTAEEILDPDKEIAFPESVVGMLEGKLGQPPGGWPKAFQQKVLRGKEPITGRPGATLPDADFDAKAKELEAKIGREPTQREILSSLLYPQVFSDYVDFQLQYSDPSVLPTSHFFDGLIQGEEVGVELEPGKTLIVKLTAVSEPNHEGLRTVFFELNGQPREVSIVDRDLGVEVKTREKAEPDNPDHVASPMPGIVSTVAVAVGDEVKKGQKLGTIEAMKMETTLYAERDGTIARVTVRPADQLQGGDLMFVFE